nr:MAG TPA: YopX protein [Caudoviricetes sp.]
MNREILFRGKRLDNGDWVEGYYTELPCGSLGATIFSNDDELVCEDTKSYIIKVFTKQHTNYSNSNPLQVIECEKYEVIPETVGQFTGLCDKNGNKIFEGDIVKVTTGLEGYKSTYHSTIHRVTYDVRNCGVAVFYPFDNSDMVEAEVIGNIYDNPELWR